MTNYFEAIRLVGAHMIERDADIPDFRLGVERAENLAHVPIDANYIIAVQRPVTQYDYEQAYEKVAYNGVSDGVTDSSFENDADSLSIWGMIEAGRGGEWI